MKVESLTIKKFRGIKNLTIPFNGKSWVIQGRNGSGKSGVVDAIEFALSGKIGRLSGEGRGDVSVKEHGPHVDSRKSPEEAEVTLGLDFVSGDKLKLFRNCKVPTKFTSEPKLEQSREVYFGNEIVLSRREILKFVLTEPGKRSKEVQALLKIEKLDEIRSALKTLSNRVSATFDAEERDFEKAKSKLKEWLQVAELNKDEFLTVVNTHRAKLQLPALTEISDEFRIHEGIKQTGQSRVFLNKVELNTSVKTIRSILKDEKNVFAQDSSEFMQMIAELLEKESDLQKLNRLTFYEAGLPLINTPNCPFCDQAWPQDDLKSLVRQKVTDLSGIKSLKTKVETKFLKLKAHWKNLLDEIQSFEEKIKKEDSFSLINLKQIKSDIDLALQIHANEYLKVQTRLAKPDTLGLTFESNNALGELEDLKSKINALPEKADEEKATEFLVICQERYENYKASKKRYEYQKKKRKLATLALETFNISSEEYLNDLYKEIEQDFSKFYQIVNHDDEASFTGSLLADAGSLDFKVDFFDKGKFPPAAYHSEGHQDGMGLCLYLALMKKILGNQFTLAILDDVLMSIDEEHKKSFCKLLKKEFPETQFIITTHDRYWQKQLITEGLVNHSTTLQFKNWSVETGPTVWNEKDSWAEIDHCLESDDVPEASHKLRRFLEYLMDNLSVRLVASIPRTATGDHDLGDLLIGVTSRYMDLLKKGIKSAKSWNNDALATRLEKEKDEYAECLRRVNSEAWAVNAMVHFNAWANMEKHAFREVKEAYHQLVNVLTCSKCQTLLHVLPPKGNSESLKCDCNERAYNLKIKD
jgi:DNA repair exonuclease SbcCD ATPase subunit